MMLAVKSTDGVAQHSFEEEVARGRVVARMILEPGSVTNLKPEDVTAIAKAYIEAARARPILSGAQISMRVVREVLDERDRQEDRWGEQNHPSFDQVLLDRVRASGHIAYTTSHAEAVAASDQAVHSGEEHLREELVQVAAVAVAWIEAIDRRHPKE